MDPALISPLSRARALTFPSLLCGRSRTAPPRVVLMQTCGGTGRIRAQGVARGGQVRGRARWCVHAWEARLSPCPRLIGSLWGDWWGDSRGGERPLLACHAVYVEHGPPSPSRQLTSDATDDRGRGATGDARSVFAVDVHQGVPGQQAAAAGVGPVRAVHEPGLQQALRLVRWPSSPMSNPGATDMPPGRCTRACASAMALRSTRACLSKSLPRRSRATSSWA